MASAFGSILAGGLLAIQCCVRRLSLPHASFLMSAPRRGQSRQAFRTRAQRLGIHRAHGSGRRHHGSAGLLVRLGRLL